MERTLALPIFAALLLAGCGDVGCGNEVSYRAPSPNGKVEAVVFNRNCGATTDFNTQLSIVPASQVPEGSGDILVLGHCAAEALLALQ
jgi:hypothetical protein